MLALEQEAQAGPQRGKWGQWDWSITVPHSQHTLIFSCSFHLSQAPFVNVDVEDICALRCAAEASDELLGQHPGVELNAMQQGIVNRW